MEILYALLSVGAGLGILIWLGSGTSTPTGHIGTKDSDGRTELVDDMREIGNLAGMMGPSIENAYIARYALRHAKKSSRERQENEANPPDPS